MAERPDLDKLADWIDREEQAGEYRLAHANLELLVRYCRELEAENKRLRKKGAAGVLADDYHHARYLATDDTP